MSQSDSFFDHLGYLAHGVAADGVDAHWARVGEVLGAAAAAGAPATVLTVVADREAPMVVRQRAFGRVLMALARARRSGAGRLTQRGAAEPVTAVSVEPAA